MQSLVTKSTIKKYRAILFLWLHLLHNFCNNVDLLNNKQTSMFINWWWCNKSAVDSWTASVSLIMCILFWTHKAERVSFALADRPECWTVCNSPVPLLRVSIWLTHCLSVSEWEGLSCCCCCRRCTSQALFNTTSVSTLQARSCRLQHTKCLCWRVHALSAF